METRHLAEVDEIEAVELRCAKPGCSGTLRIDLMHADGFYGRQACPRCRARWAPEFDASAEATLVQALARYLRRGRGKLSTESSRGGSEDVLPPAVVLVLPPLASR